MQLFEVEDALLSIDRSFKTARRVALDDETWIDVVPGWMSGSRALLEQLAASAPWEQRDRRLFEQVFQEPRLTAEYPDVRRTPDSILAAACEALSARYGVTYDGLWLNLYRNGNDSTGWHRDRLTCREREAIVPVLTLGATRRFLIKPREGGKSIVYRPSSGDLIVMGGRAQEAWLHGVPKEPGIAERRISINFQSSAQSAHTRPESSLGSGPGKRRKQDQADSSSLDM
jgi:alkylated DNA repair dioxygenase AlkB